MRHKRSQQSRADKWREKKRRRFAPRARYDREEATLNWGEFWIVCAAMVGLGYGLFLRFGPEPSPVVETREAWAEVLTVVPLDTDRMYQTTAQVNLLMDDKPIQLTSARNSAPRPGTMVPVVEQTLANGRKTYRWKATTP